MSVETIPAADPAFCSHQTCLNPELAKCSPGIFHPSIKCVCVRVSSRRGTKQVCAVQIVVLLKTGRRVAFKSLQVR